MCACFDGEGARCCRMCVREGAGSNFRFELVFFWGGENNVLYFVVQRVVDCRSE